MKMSPPYPFPQGQLQGQDDEMNLSDLFRILLSHAWLIAGMTFICVASGLVFVYFWPPTYAAYVTVKVPDESHTTMGMLKEISAKGGSDSVETYLEICKSDTVAAKAAKMLDLASKPPYKGMTQQRLIANISKAI